VIGSIQVFRIGSDGALTALAGLPSLLPAPFSVSLDPSGRFVYSASVAGNVHRSYALGSDGTLTPLAQGAQVMSRDQPISLTVFPALSNPTAAASFTSKFAYVSNNGLDSTSSLIYGFRLDPASGALTATTPIPAARAGVKALAVDPQSRFVFSTYESSVASSGGFATYGIDANTGMLGPTPLSTTPFNISRVDAAAYAPNGTAALITNQLNDLNPPLQSLAATPTDPATGTAQSTLIPSNAFGPPLDVAIAPNGRFAYFVRNETTGFGHLGLSGLFTSPTSTLSAQPGISGKRAITIEPTGRFAYVAIAGVENSIELYSITPNGPSAGALNLLPNRVPTGGLLASDISADPTGRFLYTANSASGDISMFSINPVSGGLTPLSPATISVGGNPRSLKADYSGKFLYVLNFGSAKVQVYAINQSTGMLSQIFSEGSVGNLSFDLAVSENVE
jgi:6-phosphogluconolactonase (cycloisomerase 2 family)